MPLIAATGNFVELDIRPLLPPSIPNDRQAAMQKCFSDAFIRIASEQHPEVKLEWKLALTFFFGHKSLFSQNLDEADFKADETQLCSSYVAMVFLKAINELNRNLEEHQKIGHPFGEHEIINRIDILRLLHHWKRLNVMRVVPIDPIVAKIIEAPAL